jgi:hypothetical protein
VSYEQINGRSKHYVELNNCFDGATNIRAGDTVIFAVQDAFPANSTIPGYVAHILTGTTNDRSAVYRINIDSNNIVTLNLLMQTVPGDIVTVKKGKTYAGRDLCFEAYARRGVVPRWWPFSSTLLVDPTSTDKLVKPHAETTFDQRGTRFFSHRDQYSGPEITDIYLKFPKTTVFE